MSNRKNYNSIVFLTVYLGLVLVGATPQVLAQAATTRQFDIKTEIEFKDDLDKNPDGEQTLADYSAILLDLYENAGKFTAENRHKFNDKSKYEFDCAANIFAKGGKKFKCVGGTGIFSNVFLDSLEKINKTFPHTTEKDKQQVKINLILSDDDFFVKTSVNQNLAEQAEQFHKFYDAFLTDFKSRSTVDAKAAICQNTLLSFENSQFFIVTRLPRASIDELFAENAR